LCNRLDVVGGSSIRMCVRSDNFCFFVSLERSPLYVVATSIILCVAYYVACALIMMGRI
jgi:hypothetical protein